MAEDLKSKGGVDEIMIYCVNDGAVMQVCAMASVYRDERRKLENNNNKNNNDDDENARIRHCSDAFRPLFVAVPIICIEPRICLFL